LYQTMNNKQAMESGRQDSQTQNHPG